MCGCVTNDFKSITNCRYKNFKQLPHLTGWEIYSYFMTDFSIFHQCILNIRNTQSIGIGYALWWMIWIYVVSFFSSFLYLSIHVHVLHGIQFEIQQCSGFVKQDWDSVERGLLLVQFRRRNQMKMIGWRHSSKGSVSITGVAVNKHWEKEQFLLDIRSRNCAMAPLVNYLCLHRL